MLTEDPVVTREVKERIGAFSSVPTAFYRVLEYITRQGGSLSLRSSPILLTEGALLERSGMGQKAANMFVHVLENFGPAEQRLLERLDARWAVELAAKYPSFTGSAALLLTSIVVFRLGNKWIKAFDVATTEEIEQIKNDPDFRSRRSASAAPESGLKPG